MIKFLFLGEVTYYAEAPPRRLRNNELFSKDDIRNRVSIAWEQADGNIEAIINSLKWRRSK